MMLISKTIFRTCIKKLKGKNKNPEQNNNWFCERTGSSLDINQTGCWLIRNSKDVIEKFYGSKLIDKAIKLFDVYFMSWQR